MTAKVISFHAPGDGRSVVNVSHAWFTRVSVVFEGVTAVWRRLAVKGSEDTVVLAEQLISRASALGRQGLL